MKSKALQILKNIRKYRKRVVPLAIGLIVILTPIAYLSLKDTQQVEAGWWDDSWSYRQKIVISKTVGAETDVYTAFDVGDRIDTSTPITAGKMQSDCGDIRFTTEGGNPLPYIINSGDGACNTTTTDMDVFFDSIAVANHNIYMYYGNPSATDGFEGSGFATEATNYTIGTPASEEVGPGPVAYWKFDEGAGNKINDSAGINYGSNHGAAWTNESECLNGKCLYFAGTNDRITIQNEIIANDETFTVSAWIRVGSSAGNKAIYGENSTSNNDRKANFNVNGTDGSFPGKIEYHHRAITDTLSVTSNVTVDDNKWHHVALTRTGATTAKVYVDGVDATTVISSDDPGSLTVDNFSIGAYVDGSTDFIDFFKGFLDEVKIYPYARSAAEIKTDFQRDSALHGAAATFGPDYTYLSEGLVGYWKMDEHSGTTVADSSAVGNTGTLTSAQESGTCHATDCNITTIVDDGGGSGLSSNDGAYNGMTLHLSDPGAGCNLENDQDQAAIITDYTGSTTTFTTDTYSTSGTDLCDFEVRHQASGKFGNGLQFDGENDYVDLGTSSDIDFSGSGSFTLSAWIKPGQATITANEIIISKANSTTDNRETRLFRHSDEGLDFYIDDDGAAGAECNLNHTASTLTDTNWHHVVAIFDDDNDVIKTFIDGSLQDTTACTTNPFNGNANWIVANQADLGDPYEGNIDEVRIYNRALPASEVKKLYEWAPEPIGHWKFDVPSNILSDTAPVSQSSDDSEECASGGAMDDGTSSDLEFIDDPDRGDCGGNTNQIVGVRFQNIDIPQGTQITNAFVQFVGDNEATSGPISLTISGEDDDNASTFTTDASNISGRTQTTSKVAWGDLPDWPVSATNWQTVFDTRTPDISPIIQEIVDRSGWSSGNSIVIIIEGEGRRNVASWDNTFRDPPVLLINSFVNDSSGSGFDASLQGAMSAGDFVPGKFGSGLEFDGSDDYLEAQNREALRVHRSMTLEAWIKPFNVGSQDRIIHRKMNNSRSTYGLYCDDNTAGTACDVNFRATDCSDTFTDVGTDDVNSVNENELAHIAATFDTDTNTVRLFVNGVNTETFTSFTRSVCPTRGNELIQHLEIGGHSLHSGNRWFDGIIDDVRMYDYARTPGQIIEDMNAGHPAPGSPVGSAVGHWKFNEGYGDTAYDSSPQGNNGDLNGTGSVCPAGSFCPDWTNNGKFGKALDFELGDSGDSVDVTDDTSLDLETEVSISTWIQLESTPGGSEYRSVVIKEGTVDLNYGLQTFGDELDFSFYESGYQEHITTGVDLQTGTWYHVVATFSETSNEVRLYVNGILRYSASETGNMTSNSGDLYFGWASGEYWDGLIDEVQIFNSTLTADQVKLLYNQGSAAVLGATGTDSSNNPTRSADNEYCPPGQGSTCTPPVGHWNFDEKQGLYANDISGNGNQGTLGIGSSAPTWVNVTDAPPNANGLGSSALDFDGSNDYVDVGLPSVLDITGAVTYEAWVKLDSNQNNNVLSRSEEATDRGTNLETNVGATYSNVEFNIFEDTGTCNTQHTSGASTTELINGQWYHVVGVYEPSSYVKIFVNGVLENEDTSGISASQCGNNDVTIGNRSDFLGDFDGTIDQVRIYDYARTPTQIAYDYNRGGPIGWWKFDECQGATAYDASGNGNNGTITPGGAPNTSVGTCSSGAGDEMWDNGTTGKRNASLDFDGTDDYVYCTDANCGGTTGGGLDMGTSDLTVTGWVKVTSNNTALIVKGGYTGSEDGWHVFVSSNGRLKATITDFGDPDSPITTTDDGDVINDDSWHHIAVVYDRSGDISRYIDGALSGSLTSISLAPGTVDATQEFRIGARDKSGSELFTTGQIDDVKVFNYALTSQQIKTQFNEGAVKFD